MNFLKQYENLRENLKSQCSKRHSWQKANYLQEVLECWKTHFDEHLNTKFPHENSATDNIPITHDEEKEMEDINKDDEKLKKKTTWNKCHLK